MTAEITKEQANKVIADKLDQVTALLAIERSLVPHPGVLTAQQAFLKALEKVCTSITSGWFRAYAYDNYDKVVDLFNPDYETRFWDAVKDGRVKPFTKASY